MAKSKGRNQVPEDRPARKVKAAPDKPRAVWKGPEEDGVTFSLLCKFLSCRERFRLLVMDGLQPARTFSGPIEFGNMWHVCEEAAGGVGNWTSKLQEYATKLCREYPMSQDDVAHWYSLCRIMFPEYTLFWAGHDSGVTFLMNEEKFAVPYALPSGRKVLLRGKWDGVFLKDTRPLKTVWLQENKTKGEVDVAKIERQLKFDLQTMIYLVAMTEHKAATDADDGLSRHDGSIAGVRYNVVKRPRHYQGKKETHGEFLDRFRGVVSAAPEEFFFRWDVEVTPDDVRRFRVQCLDPILEQLCDWWEHIRESSRTGADPFVTQDRTGVVYSENTPANAPHWRQPYGLYNTLDGSDGLDDYMDGTSAAVSGLEKTDQLFPELQ